ncbi:MAG: hypothetical protein KFF49_09750 [Bacteroidales bacterium]|nr:hypothetical protein [Bacteroidales bacterium]
MKTDITTIPLSGFLEHKDEPVSLPQIWVLPERRDVEPRYDQISYYNSKLLNNLYRVISTDKSDSGSWIYQQSWFSLGDLEKRDAPGIGESEEIEIQSKEKSRVLLIEVPMN